MTLTSGVKPTSSSAAGVVRKKKKKENSVSTVFFSKREVHEERIGFLHCVLTFIMEHRREYFLFFGSIIVSAKRNANTPPLQSMKQMQRNQNSVSLTRRPFEPERAKEGHAWATALALMAFLRRERVNKTFEE